MHEIEIKKNDAGQRLDKFLQKSLFGLPPALMYRYIREKKIKLNRKRAEGKTMLCEGDVLQLFIRDEFFGGGEKAGDEKSLSSIKPNLAVVYEDENIIVVNKRQGVLVHDDSDGQSDTLLLHIKAYLYQKGEYNPLNEQSFAPALCNRIDRNTGGMVIAAKNAAALREMDEKIRDGQVSKFYILAVHGIMREKSATLHAWLKKDARTNTVKIYDAANKPRDAKNIATKYTVLRERGGNSLLEVQLLTGRTHQIRAQMAYIGHPLLGDGKYGNIKDDKREGYKYQALYSYRLRFDFADKSGELGYLCGRELCIPNEQIWFIKNF